MSIRISGSSSTIRTSYAIRHLCGQYERCDRSRTVSAIVECQPSAVVFHDLLHNGEAQPCPFRLMSYIRFSEPRTIFLWQSYTIIGHDDANLALVALHAEADMAGVFAHGDGIGSVLQQIGQRLPNEPAIAGSDRSPFGDLGAPVDLWARGLLQHQHFPCDTANILEFDDRLRHAREGRELIHHAADIADMADDGVGALLE